MQTWIFRLHRSLLACTCTHRSSKNVLAFEVDAKDTLLDQTLLILHLSKADLLPHTKQSFLPYLSSFNSIYVKHARQDEQRLPPLSTSHRAVPSLEAAFRGACFPPIAMPTTGITPYTPNKHWLLQFLPFLAFFSSGTVLTLTAVMPSGSIHATFLLLLLLLPPPLLCHFLGGTLYKRRKNIIARADAFLLLVFHSKFLLFSIFFRLNYQTLFRKVNQK